MRKGKRRTDNRPWHHDDDGAGAWVVPFTAFLVVCAVFAAISLVW